MRQTLFFEGLLNFKQVHLKSEIPFVLMLSVLSYQTNVKTHLLRAGLH